MEPKFRDAPAPGLGRTLVEPLKERPQQGAPNRRAPNPRPDRRRDLDQRQSGHHQQRAQQEPGISRDAHRGGPCGPFAHCRIVIFLITGAVSGSLGMGSAPRRTGTSASASITSIPLVTRPKIE